MHRGRILRDQAGKRTVTENDFEQAVAKIRKGDDSEGLAMYC